MEAIENLKKLKENLKALLENVDKNINSLYTLATHDPKTGLHNFRFFSEILEIEFEKAKRGSKLSLAIFDIDNFKQINTKHGYTKADKFLKKIAEIIKQSIRKSDIAARFGGEEFIVLLPNTTTKRAKRVAERIRKQVEAEFNKKVTISGGLSEYRKKESLTKFKQKAEKSLKQAKKDKNKII